MPLFCRLYLLYMRTLPLLVTVNASLAQWIWIYHLRHWQWTLAGYSIWCNITPTTYIRHYIACFFCVCVCFDEFVLVGTFLSFIRFLLLLHYCNCFQQHHFTVKVIMRVSYFYYLEDKEEKSTYSNIIIKSKFPSQLTIYHIMTDMMTGQCPSHAGIDY